MGNIVDTLFSCFSFFVFPVKHILKDNLFSVSCLPPGLWPIVFPCFYCDYIIAQFIIKYNKISIKY
nr:MAG TPA: hypothetical protein [Caudoviricetes sp.]